MHAAGGPELCSAANTPPLYKRAQLPHSVFKRQLAAWQGHLQQQALPHASPHLTLDVVIPSYRANPVLLEKLLTCSVTEPAVSVRFLLQIDEPKLPTTASSYVSQKQEQLLHMLRVRHNNCSIGAGKTRNALLEASAAQYVVFFDDDVEPSVGCLDAYVQAARQHPEAAGFAGKQQLVKTAMCRHMLLGLACKDDSLCAAVPSMTCKHTQGQLAQHQVKSLNACRANLPASRARVGGSRSATIRCGLLLGGAKQHCLPPGALGSHSKYDDQEHQPKVLSRFCFSCNLGLTSIAASACKQWRQHAFNDFRNMSCQHTPST